MELERRVLDAVLPSYERRREIERSVKSLLVRVEEETGGLGLGLQVMLVGSVAKDTFLSEPDIDIFILFPEDTSRERLERVGLETGRRVLGDGEERYAEHPYIHGVWDGMEVDLVPCYRITDTSRLMSAVDRTPFHTRYVREHLGVEQRNEVRLLKQFAKGIGVYGAEAKVQGFSGYLLELLVMRYGSFQGVLEAATSWKKGKAIDLEGAGTKRFNEPLVFYDPVDPNRNVASALSADKLALFIYAARQYLDGPSERYFFPRARAPLELESIRDMLRERGTSVLLVTLDRPELIDDNLYPQVRRTLDGLAALLETHDYRVVDKGFYLSRDISLVVELESSILPSARRHHGPPAWIDNSTAFLEKWRAKGLGEPFLENGHWIAIARREFTRAEDLVMAKFYSSALGSDLKGLRGLSAKAGSDVLTEENRGALSVIYDKKKNWEV